MCDDYVKYGHPKDNNICFVAGPEKIVRPLCPPDELRFCKWR